MVRPLRLRVRLANFFTLNVVAQGWIETTSIPKDRVYSSFPFLRVLPSTVTKMYGSTPYQGFLLGGMPNWAEGPPCWSPHNAIGLLTLQAQAYPLKTRLFSVCLLACLLLLKVRGWEGYGWYLWDRNARPSGWLGGRGKEGLPLCHCM